MFGRTGDGRNEGSSKEGDRTTPPRSLMPHHLGIGPPQRCSSTLEPRTATESALFSSSPHRTRTSNGCSLVTDPDHHAIPVPEWAPRTYGDFRNQASSNMTQSSERREESAPPGRHRMVSWRGDRINNSLQTHRPSPTISRKDSSAAASVASISAAPCARETNQASYCDGGR